MLRKDKELILNSILTSENNKALSYLYDTTLKKVRKYILSNNGSKDEADDIFQDAVIIFFHKVRDHKFDINQEIDAFIFIVAKNLWINKAKRDKRQVRFDNPQPYEDRLDDFNQLNELIGREKSKALTEVFQKLDEKCQKILHYFIYQKLSMKEISIRMGYSSEDVAKTNHYRCKKYLTELVRTNKQIYNLLKE